ncbi:hypothetical protein [Glaciibacter sp. 2TAF33]|uniref:hypothetical protein n=1 Tax=Glaciibacter sp. 2TAF33 TaxID=3233015 RepID=UPI003F8FD909
MPDAEPGAGSDGPDFDALIEGIHAVMARAVQQLRAAGARDEALARFVPSRRILFVEKRPAMHPLGRVWRLGVFLLGPDGTLYQTGSITRASDPKYRGFQSVSAEVRREHRAAAFRGPFARDETVNFDATVIRLEAGSLGAAGPLHLDGGRALVRWSAGSDATVEFEPYLTERVNLLVRPPEGT